jgi:hypothetical protein
VIHILAGLILAALALLALNGVIENPSRWERAYCALAALALSALALWAL